MRPSPLPFFNLVFVNIQPSVLEPRKEIHLKQEKKRKEKRTRRICLFAHLVTNK